MTAAEATSYPRPGRTKKTVNVSFELDKGLIIFLCLKRNWPSSPHTFNAIHGNILGFQKLLLILVLLQLNKGVELFQDDGIASSAGLLKPKKEFFGR